MRKGTGDRLDTEHQKPANVNWVQVFLSVHISRRCVKVKVVVQLSRSFETKNKKQKNLVAIQQAAFSVPVLCDREDIAVLMAGS